MLVAFPAGGLIYINGARPGPGARRPELAQQAHDLGVLHLLEILVELADRGEVLGREEACDVVAEWLEAPQRVGGRHRDREDDLVGIPGLEEHAGPPASSSPSRCRRRDDDRGVLPPQRPAWPPEQLAPARDLRELMAALPGDVVRRSPRGCPARMRSGAARRPRRWRESELGLKRRPQLAREHDVELGRQRAGEYRPDHDAAARNRQDQGILQPARLEELRQLEPRVLAILNIGRLPPAKCAQRSRRAAIKVSLGSPACPGLDADQTDTVRRRM